MATEKELLEAIDAVEKQALPLRTEREQISQQIEALKLKARALSRQILEIEDRAQVRHFELKMLRKRIGRLTTMTVEPARA